MAWGSRDPATPPNQGATGDFSSDADRPSEAPGASAAAVSSASEEFARRPELFVGAAFVGGFAVAKILKQLGP